METITASWLGTGLIVLAVVAVLMVGLALLARALPIGSASFYCPWARRRVSVRYLLGADRASERLLSCTALGDPVGTPCGAECLREGGPADLTTSDRAPAGPTRG